jgi:hypothetical protein
MSVFAIGRSETFNDVFALLFAINTESAIAIIQEHEEAGALEEPGYSGTRRDYFAVPANANQVAKWTATVAAATREKRPVSLHEAEDEWIVYFAQPKKIVPG